MELKKYKQIIESIMFAAGRQVTSSELAGVLELTPSAVDEIIDDLKSEYENQERGIQIIKVNDGYQMSSIIDNYEYIYPIIDKRNKPNLSQAALETLAIIAYNQPISTSEVREIRGVQSGQLIRKLVAKGLIKEAGKSDLSGHPNLYRTTREFLDYFGLATLEDLPNVELKEEIEEDETDLFNSIYKDESDE